MEKLYRSVFWAADG